jgi:RNA polymerase sigma-70 factor (ECF subfamily)
MYKYQGSFEGWMKRIIINTAIDHYRTNRKHLLDVEIENIENLSNGNTEIYQKLEAKEIIKKIQMMPEGYKQIFNLYAIEGYKHIEIAKLLQISRVHLNRNMLKLKNGYRFIWRTINKKKT